jgi:uncharacterized membrane protein
MAERNESDSARPPLSTDRLKAFVDGVMAIVVTLLVLTLEVPEVDFSDGGSRDFFVELGSQLHPYVASFGLGAAYWIQHAVILHYAPYCDRGFLWLNILFLLPLTLLPFLTQLRVSYPSEAIPAALYGGGQILCGLLLMAIWRRATGPKGFRSSSIDPAVVRSMSIRIALGPLLCLTGALVDLVNPQVGTLFFLMVPLLYVSQRKVDESWQSAVVDDE